MHLALQLLGGLRKRGGGNPAIGQGELVTAPLNYFGNPEIDGLGIIINSINFVQDPEGTNGPTAIKCWADVSVAGSRKNGKSIKETHIEKRWTITYADDSPLPYGNEGLDSQGNVLNPFTDWYGDVFAPVLDELRARTYKVTCVARLKASDGRVWQYSKSVTFSKTDFTGDLLWHDGVNGNNANDGLQALHDVILDDASYDEATGILSQTGKFTNYNHTEATSQTYDINNYNKIYIYGYGLLDIAEKIDNNSVRIADYHKLGSNQTGLVSSDGPKQTFTELSFFDTRDNTLYMLSARNSDDWDFDYGADFANKTGTLGIVFYGGIGTITPSAQMVTDVENGDIRYLIGWKQAESTSKFPTWIFLSNAVFDAEDGTFVSNGAFTSPVQTNTIHIITKNCTMKRAKDNSAFQIQGYPDGRDFYWTDHNSKLENYRRLAINYTIDTATAGSNVFTVNEAITPETETKGFVEFANGERYRFNGIIGKQFQISGERLPSTLATTHASGTTIVVSERRDNVMFASLTSFAMFATTFGGVVDAYVYHHGLYPSVYGDNNVAFGVKMSSDSDVGYMINFNNDSGHTVHRHSFVKCAPLGCKYFLDSSNDTNQISSEQITGVYVSEPQGSTEDGFMLVYIALDVFITGLRSWNENPNNAPIFQCGVGGASTSEGEFWFDYEHDFVIAGAKSYNRPLFTDRNGLGDYLYTHFIDMLEVYNCEHYMNGTAVTFVNVGKEEANLLVVKDCNFYAPDDADGLIFNVDDTQLNLADFNTAVGYTNTSTEPNWDITAILNGNVAGFDGPTSYYLTLNGTDQRITVTQFSILGGGTGIRRDSISIDYIFTDSTGTIISGSSGQVPGLGLNSWVITWTTAYGEVEIDGTPVTSGQDVSSIINDGLVHTVTFYPTTGYGIEIDFFGQGLAGIPSNIVVDKNGSTTQWLINSGSTTTEDPVVDENGFGPITFENVTDLSWASE